MSSISYSWCDYAGNKEQLAHLKQDVIDNMYCLIDLRNGEVVLSSNHPLDDFIDIENDSKTEINTQKLSTYAQNPRC